MTRRIYLASSWRNTHQVQLVATLRESGFEVYDFRNPTSGGPVTESTPQTGFSWRACDPDWLVAADPFESYRAMLEHPAAQRGFAADFAAMQWADTCVLLMPSGRSAHIEAGWMVGAGKRLVVYQPTLEGFEPELMYMVGGAPKAVLAGDEGELLDLLCSEHVAEHVDARTAFLRLFDAATIWASVEGGPDVTPAQRLVARFNLRTALDTANVAWRAVRRERRATLDAAELTGVLDAIRDEVLRLSGLASPETAKRIVEAVEARCRSIRTLHLDPGATGAGDHRIALEVPEGLRELLAALRAFDGHGELVLEGHGPNRSGGEG